MNRVYHPYWLWEDYNSGMYDTVESHHERRLLPIAFQFTGDAERYGAAMNRVINQWKYCCENNLTNKSLNRRAWIGHAACSIELKLPEYIVRSAWWRLTDRQRDDANAQADKYISIWEKQNEEIGSPDRQINFDGTMMDKIRSYIEVWKHRCYPELPDTAPDVLERIGIVPSYRRIAWAILKNDISLDTLGFRQRESSYYGILKRVEIEQRKRQLISTDIFGIKSY